MIKMESKQELKEENIKKFEIVGQNNFGIKINKIDWKGTLKKAGIILLVVFILFMILR